MSLAVHRYLLTLCLVLNVLQPAMNQGRVPGCPPPIATFIAYAESVMVPKVLNQEVVTVKVRENNYFGKTRCSIPQELQDRQHTLFQVFRVEEGPNIDRIKYCTIYLKSTDFPEQSLSLNLLLITDLIPGLDYCDGPISAKARINVNFCQSISCSEELGVLDRNNRILQEGQADIKKGEQQTGVASVGSDTDPDPNKIIIIGIVFVVTLIAMSLIIGLIYFWCPEICGLCLRGRTDDDLGTTKILTVRDNFGNIIPEAKSVEVWKTKENKIKSYDLPANNARKSRKGYDKLSEEPEEYSNFNSREESHRVVEARSNPEEIVLLKKQKSPRNASRLTVLEELDPRTLSPFGSLHRSSSRIFRVVKKEESDKLKVLTLEDYNHSAPTPVEVFRPEEYNGQSLNFSRHYVNHGRPSQIIIEVDRDQRLEPAKQLHRRRSRHQESRRDGRQPHDYYSYDQLHQGPFRQEDSYNDVPVRDERQRQADVQVLRVHDESPPYRKKEKEVQMTQDGRDEQKLVHRPKKVMVDESSQSSLDTGTKGSNTYQYYDDQRSEIQAADQASQSYSVHDSQRSELKRAMSAISVIMEGDPSDYEEEEADRDPGTIPEEDQSPSPPSSLENSTENMSQDIENVQADRISADPTLSESKADLKDLVNSLDQPEEPREPLSQRLAKNLTEFKDTNRTPSPAVGVTESVLQKARTKRSKKFQHSMETINNLNAIKVVS